MLPFDIIGRTEKQKQESRAMRQNEKKGKNENKRKSTTLLQTNKHKNLQQKTFKKDR